MTTLLRFESGLAGASWAYNNGDIVQWDNDAEAQRLIDRLIATPLFVGDADQDAARIIAELRARGAYIRNHAVARERDRRLAEQEYAPWGGMPPLSDLPEGKMPKSNGGQQQYMLERAERHKKWQDERKRAATAV